MHSQTKPIPTAEGRRLAPPARNEPSGGLGKTPRGSGPRASRIAPVRNEPDGTLGRMTGLMDQIRARILLLPNEPDGALGRLATFQRPLSSARSKYETNPMG